MSKKAIRVENAPAPVGPYSPAVVFQNLVFISGQGPLDPKTGEVIDGDIVAQARQVFANLDALLNASGSSRNNVLKVTVYLSDINDFKSMNSIYADFFEGTTYPARTTIEAAALPLNISVEIDVIAYID